MPEAEPEPAAGPEEVLEIELPPLDASDPAAREYAADLSDLPEYEDLLAVDELVRRFTVVVHNVAAGKSPRFHLPFLVPRKPFGAIATGGRLVSDPKSYARYDTIGNVFASLDAEKTVRLFRAFDPLVDQAHRDLGHQRNEFEATLRRAIVELLETPVLVGPVPVQLDVLTYVYADPQIENLDPVQKLFLRMGAANVQKVQGKLREIAAALGIPEDDLPRERRLRPAG